MSESTSPNLHIDFPSDERTYGNTRLPDMAFIRPSEHTSKYQRHLVVTGTAQPCAHWLRRPQIKPWYDGFCAAFDNAPPVAPHKHADAWEQGYQDGLKYIEKH